MYNLDEYYEEIKRTEILMALGLFLAREDVR